jgi:ATP-dependent DNA helicase RecG
VVLTEKIIKIPGQAEALRIWNYPYEAVEEIIANAFYHRGYEDPSSIEISVYPDKIVVLSFPGPLPPVDKKMLKEKKILSRNYRNRRIGDFLRELNLTEGRGTGFPIIYQKMQQNGSPEPIFETDDLHTHFLAILPIHPEFLKADNTIKKAILNFCEKPKSRKEILNMLQLTNHTKNFNKHIKPLLEQRLLSMTLPDMPQSSKQQYKTTKEDDNQFISV